MPVSADTYLEPTQTFTIFLKPLTISAKFLIVDVQVGPKYAPEAYPKTLFPSQKYVNTKNKKTWLMILHHVLRITL